MRSRLTTVTYVVESMYVFESAFGRLCYTEWLQPQCRSLATFKLQIQQIAHFPSTIKRCTRTIRKTLALDVHRLFHRVFFMNDTRCPSVQNGLSPFVAKPTRGNVVAAMLVSANAHAAKYVMWCSKRECISVRGQALMY
jgi:hypothetical protein